MILEIGTLASTAIGYIIGGIKKSKGLAKAVDEISVAIWEWIKPIFLEDDEDLVKEVEENPDDKNLQIELQNKIKRLAKKDPGFANQLEELLKKTPKGSELIAEKMKAKQGVSFNAKMTDSNAKLSDFDAGEGKIDIDIDLS